jgi:hypothetical protein
VNVNDTLIYAGSAVIILWGIAHLIPTRQIIKGFGDISADNKKILAMELLSEGLTLIFLGVLPMLIILYGDTQSQTAHIVFFAEAGMLLVMAVVTTFTGARTPVFWYKLCPAVKVIVAAFFVLGSVL